MAANRVVLYCCIGAFVLCRSSSILMLGAEINAFFFAHIHPLPYDLLTFTSLMVRACEANDEAERMRSHQKE